MTTLWLTGLPAAGKTTLARAVAEALRSQGRAVLVLDGDEVRDTLSAGLGFDAAARDENVRRVAVVALLAARSQLVTVVALVSPLRAAREAARAAHVASGVPFFEIFLSAPAEVCAQRDPKGLWARARAGQAKQVTGHDAPYEAPLKPELVIAPEFSVTEAVRQVLTSAGMTQPRA